MNEKVLTKDEILRAKDSRIEKVEIPEWNGWVYVRSMTGKERDCFEVEVLAAQAKRNYSNMRAMLIALTVTNETGKRLFTAEDIDKLGEKSASALDRLFAVSSRLSRITPKDVQELTENLSVGPKGGSTSD